MKRRVLKSFAANLCSFLISRNNDISGYWGIGILCALAQKYPKPIVSFSANKGHPIKIGHYEITGSLSKLDSIYGKHNVLTLCSVRFIENGFFDNNKTTYAAVLSASSICDGNHCLHTDLTYCWAHDPLLESNRA
jgi:hypothetical protein